MVGTATPHEQMLQLVTGYWVSQVIRGAAASSLADRLAGGARSADELARDGALHPDVALRFLRACAALGLVAPAADGRFASTPLLQTLREDDPASLRGLALSQGAPGHWLPWGRLPDVLATGRRQTIEALGVEVFDYYAAHPGEAADFSRAMSGMTAAIAAEVTRVLDTRNVSHVVDVGGAEGALLRAVLGADARLRGTLFDAPGVVDRARGVVAATGLADRIDLIGGSFFAQVPAGDLYLLKFILHDWDDESCLSILRNCRRSCAPGGRIAVIEIALGAIGEGGPFAPLMDLNMMVLASGRERTFAEYAGLLKTSGFSGARATPIAQGMLVIEADAG